jgi:hypothetical protein
VFQATLDDAPSGCRVGYAQECRNMADIQETKTPENLKTKHSNGWGFTPWHLAPLLIVVIALIWGYWK